MVQRTMTSNMAQAAMDILENQINGYVGNNAETYENIILQPELNISGSTC